ncbi:hypothetical protein GIB67_027852 [Kingdonia uniflora]|uniref:Pentatricopeptide repeat-containing protein n=1 Tax=Kingdonia uniflora TaxID=39325 RepID=A0A7J7P4N1_9MAGN|nr:hypothetical protein GIB67_027852 [Kingdonia uniflora]
MPLEPNSVLWRTLLGSCRIYGNVELAEKAFKKILELYTPTNADFILISNAYAESEIWGDVERVRAWDVQHCLKDHANTIP